MLEQPLSSVKYSSTIYSPGSSQACVTTGPELSVVPSAKSQLYSTILKPAAGKEAVPSKLISSPTQILLETGPSSVAAEIGRSQGVEQVILPPKFPVPLAFESNTKVKQPLVFCDVAETKRPAKSFPVYEPKLGAEVSSPSKMAI